MIICSKSLVEFKPDCPDSTDYPFHIQAIDQPDKSTSK